MIVWGGTAGTYGEIQYNTGGRYSPADDKLDGHTHNCGMPFGAERS